MLSILFFEVKAQQYFVSFSYMFLYKRTLLKIWLNPGLNLTSFEEPGSTKCSLMSFGYPRQTINHNSEKLKVIYVKRFAVLRNN